MFAGGLGDATILHAGRTGGLAGAAKQTELQMLLEAIVQLDAPVSRRFDQMDSAARRFGFKTGDAIGRTLVQAQTAVDALVEFGEVQTRHSRLLFVGSGMMAMFQVLAFVSRAFRDWCPGLSNHRSRNRQTSTFLFP